MSAFSDESLPLQLLRKNARNRWGGLPQDVIPLTAADPDFQVAPPIREAIASLARDGVFSYGESYGNKDFRETIAETVTARKNSPCTPDDVMVTNGVAQAMMLVAAHACKPGDEAILFDPVDFLFGRAVDHAGAKKIYSPIDKETRKIDVDNVNSLVTPRTRLLCICNPHNPLGRVLTKKELQGLAEIAVDNGLTIMSDEIWSDIVYDGRKHIATASLNPETARRTISLYGFSKTFAMAGLSIGYAVSTDPETLAGLKGRAPAYFYPVNNVSQAAGRAAYEDGWPWAEAFLEHLQGNRDTAYRRLNEIPGVTCQRPEGTYAIFPDISSHGLTSEEMTQLLLEEARVAVVPGHGPGFSYFGPGAEGNIRIVYSSTRKVLEEALDRIEKTLTNL